MVFGDVGSTMMACEEPEMSFEGPVPRLSRPCGDWRVGAAGSELADADGAVLLVFEPRPDPPSRGHLDAAPDPSGGRTIDVPEGVDVTLLLEHGQASGSRAATRSSAATSSTGPRCASSAVGGTEMACQEPLMGVEGAYLAALALVASWEADAASLRLLDAGGTVVAVLEAAPAA